jgi:integrase
MSTRARDQTYLANYALPAFGETSLSAITQLDVRAWVTGLSARGLAPATVVKAYQLLGKTLGAAVDSGLIPRSPCRAVPLPRVQPEEMRFLAPADVGRLATAIDPRYRAFVLLGAYGGLRIGELAGLKRHRVDLLHGRVDIAEILVEVRGTIHTGPPKTRAGRRSVGLPPPLVQALEDHLSRNTAGDLVFPAPGGGPLRSSLFRRRVWHPATLRAGLPHAFDRAKEGEACKCGLIEDTGNHERPLRPHDLRHTAVALWIAAGANPKEVAARAGHTSVSFTLDRYGHLFPEADERLRDRLGQMFEEAEQIPGGTVLPLSR